jgi:acyl-CoA thioesterase-1
MQMRKMLFLSFILLLASIGTGCKKDQKISSTPMNSANDSLYYIPFGDSFTAGHGANPDQAYPVLMVNDLNKEKIKIKMIVNAALGGHTTAEAYRDEMPVFNSSNANFASVMLGANDWGRGTDTVAFRSDFRKMIDGIEAKLVKKTNLLIITLPDLSATPGFRSQANGKDIVKDVNYLNSIIKQEAAHYHLPVADIYPLSQEMHNDASLRASDSLHPSAKEYARWEQFVILPAAEKMLK